MPSRRSAWLALILLTPAPTIGAAAALWWWPGTTLGMSVYTACKLWLLALPVLWRLGIDRARPHLSRPSRAALNAGWIWGLIIAVAIGSAYLIAARMDWIDAEAFRSAAAKNRLDRPLFFVLGGVYFCTINALLEEYVWRWFVVGRLQKIAPNAIAVALGALLFTVHHVIALRAQFDWSITLTASLGVFAGGVIWSALYAKYRSVWPCFVSHAIADVAVMAAGYHLLFS